MIEIDDYAWESLFVLKDIYDHNDKSPVLGMYKDTEIDGDYLYEITLNSIGTIFEDTRNYYDEEKEFDVYVFFDPIITDYWRLCDEYEIRTGTPKEKNTYREEMFRAINNALSFPEYSYGIYSYEDTSRRNGCRLVLVLGLEFYCHYMVPSALCEAYDAFEYHTQRLKKALAELGQPKLMEFSKKNHLRKAAA